MKLTKGFALSLTVVLASVLVNHVESAAGTPAATSGIRLKTISSRMNSKGASLVIEASEPTSYVATRPDPLTVVIDFRNVQMEGFANAIRPDAKSPISSVAVEPTEVLGSVVTRVRIGLAQPVTHHVRSDRNTVVVDFDKTLEKATLGQAAESRRLPDALNALKTASVNPAALLPPVQAPQSPQAASAARLIALGSNKTSFGQQSSFPSPATQTPGSGIALPAQGTQRRYEGHPVSMQFEGLDLRAVLRLFAEISGLNIVIDPTVQGSVDVALTEVPWDQALDIILRANKLGFVVDGTIVRIAPLTVLAEEQTLQRKLADEQALAGELRVVTKTLSYARAETLEALLKASVLSSRGQAQVDVRTNTIIITDLQPRLTTADELITALDRPQPQVEIEARVVQTNKDFARQLGIQWGFSGRMDPTLGNTTNLAFPNNGSLAGRAATQGPAGTGSAVNLPVVGASSAVGLALGSVNGAFNLDVALSALETQGNAKVLSTPRVTPLNNVPAEMTQGVQIPYQTVSNNTVTIAFKDAALQLKVTPQITAAGTVIMNIFLENATPDFSKVPPGSPPPINTQRAVTTLLVNDGDTTVIGGIYTNNVQTAQGRTPGLGQIPLLSWLFKRDTIDDRSSELLIFITPRIIKA
jgi:type IV pilus assembly protein PilQ